MIFWEKRRDQKHIALLIPATLLTRSEEGRPAKSAEPLAGFSFKLPLTVMGFAFCFTYLEI
jgi:hypothetical protein